MSQFTAYNIYTVSERVKDFNRTHKNNRKHSKTLVINYYSYHDGYYN